MIYQVKSRIKVAIVLFFILLMFVGFGVWFHTFRSKEPTHGVFVYNHDDGVREEQVCGYLYKPSKKDNHY